MSDLDFIKDKELRSTIENSIEYIYALYEEVKKGEQNLMYKEETYRVIILYVISAIEAILLYFYKERKEKIEHAEYKFIQKLANYSHKEKQELPVIIAVQEQVENNEHQIGLYDLVTLFKNKGLIQEKTAGDIIEINDVRNTFHFSKPRTKKCDLERVESALSLLVRTIKKAPTALKVK